MDEASPEDLRAYSPHLDERRVPIWLDNVRFTPGRKPYLAITGAIAICDDMSHVFERTQKVSTEGLPELTYGESDGCSTSPNRTRIANNELNKLPFDVPEQTYHNGSESTAFRRADPYAVLDLPHVLLLGCGSQFTYNKTLERDKATSAHFDKIYERTTTIGCVLYKNERPQLVVVGAALLLKAYVDSVSAYRQRGRFRETTDACSSERAYNARENTSASAGRTDKSLSLKRSSSNGHHHEDEEQDFESFRGKKARFAKENTPPIFLACPFHKYDPWLFGPNSPYERYRVCGTFCFVQIGVLRQHLRRKHCFPEYMCLTCWQVFKNQSSLHSHSMAPCIRPARFPFPEMLDKALREELSIDCEAGRGVNPFQYWWKVFDVLFPGTRHTRDISPYFQGPLVEHLQRFATFAQAHAPQVLPDAMYTLGEGALNNILSTAALATLASEFVTEAVRRFPLHLQMLEMPRLRQGQLSAVLAATNLVPIPDQTAAEHLPLQSTQSGIASTFPDTLRSERVIRAADTFDTQAISQPFLEVRGPWSSLETVDSSRISNINPTSTSSITSRSMDTSDALVSVRRSSRTTQSVPSGSVMTGSLFRRTFQPQLLRASLGEPYPSILRMHPDDVASNANLWESSYGQPLGQTFDGSASQDPAVAEEFSFDEAVSVETNVPLGAGEHDLQFSPSDLPASSQEYQGMMEMLGYTDLEGLTRQLFE